MAKRGNDLTTQQRKLIIPCAAKLNGAIDDAERGYRIQIGQPGNGPAQRTAQALFAKARAQVDECSEVASQVTGQLKSNGPQAGSTKQDAPKMPPLHGDADNAEYGMTLPAMQGETTFNGERFSITTVSGCRVGRGFQGSVVGMFGKSAFSWASGTYISSRQFKVTLIRDKRGVDLPLKQPAIVDMSPRGPMR